MVITDRASGGGLGDLFERDIELEQLGELLARAAGGLGGLALIHGPAGIGKSALLAVIRERAHAAGVRVLVARGSELEREFAFGGVRQLFEPLIVTAEAGERARLFAGVAGRVQSLIVGDVDAGAAEQGSFGVLHGLYWLTANAAAAGSLLLCVDDVQWLDPPSLRFLAYLARRIEDMPVALVAAERVAEPEVPEALLDELRMAPGVRRVEPAPLGAESVDRLVRSELTDADDALCAACFEASAGNPFYLRELLRTLALEGGAAQADAATRVAEMSIRSVGERVVRRVERLGAEAPLLARAMAVLGDGGRLQDAALLAGLDRAYAARAAAALVKVEVLAGEDPFAFVHPLVRHSVYGQLSLAERDEAHAAAAGLLAERGAQLDEVASQLLLVRPSGSPSVVARLREAAGQARARAAADSAVTYLRRALTEPPAENEHVGVLRELGSAERLAVDTAAVEHLAEAHAVTQEPLERAQVALEYGLACMTAFDFERAAAVFTTALGELGERDPELGDQLRAELYSIMCFDPAATVKAAPEVLGLPDEPRPGPAGPTLTAIKASFLVYTGASAARIAAVARKALVEGRVASASWNGSRQAIACLHVAEDFEAMGEFLSQAVHAARARGDADMLSAAHMFLAWRARALGALADAETHSDQQLAVAGDWGLVARLYISMTRAGVFLDQGRVADAEVTMAQLAELADVPADAWPVVGGFLELQGVRARIRLVQGRTGEAAEDLEHMLQYELPGSGLQLPPHMHCRPLAATTHATLGEMERARQLADEELERARAFGGPCRLGVALRAAGIVERDLGLLEESAATLERSPAQLESARSLVELGAALRRANKRSSARERLSAGMELAHRCGAQPVVDRALEELRAAGARPRRIVRTGVDALTASELRVARLAAAGRSNQEIAQELYISLKTVEMHLGRAYAKLGLSGQGARKQLATILD